MLNEREIALAKECAGRIASVSGGSEEQVCNDILRFLGTVKSVWKGVKESLDNIFQYLNEMSSRREDKGRDFNWIVPLKIKAPPMPDIPMPIMMNIRSDL